MKDFRQAQQGVSLLEVLLVMVIALTIIYLSLQQYLFYRRAANVQALQSNIDLLFNSMARYFEANCRKAPFNVGTGYRVQPVSLTTLLAEGYLSLPDDKLPFNPLVNSSETTGYVLQFNQMRMNASTLPNRTINTCVTGDGCPVDIGKQSYWQIQVSVRVPLEYVEQYKNLLGANCIATYVSSWGVIEPCDIATTGDYLVFTRAPGLPTLKANSNFWLTMPTVKQFSQMYTTDPILILTAPTATQLNAQYYVCGKSPGNFCGGDVDCP